jgi:uncharacterized membrane protein YkoI
MRHANRKRLVPPSEIIRTLKGHFPELDMTTVEWSWEVYNKIYEAEFEHEGEAYEVEITINAELLLVEQAIDVDDVPENIIIKAEERFPDCDITEAEQIELSNGDVYFELTLVRENGEQFEVHYREDGIMTALDEDL